MAETQKPAVYCSTSGTFFTDKLDLAEHYKSDFHRYNLKRKVAGLPPVTKEWFDSRKEQLSSSAAAAAPQKVWLDPLTKKRFGSENTYTAYTRSKKYQDLVRKSGQLAPPPIVTFRRIEPSGASLSRPVRTGRLGGEAFETQSEAPVAESPARPDSSDAAPRTHTIKAPNRGPAASAHMDEDESDWETASEEDDLSSEAAEQSPQEAEKPEDWDVRRCLFNNHMSSSLEANIEYMWKKFGFYLPDSEYLVDPEGLIQYLGAKIAEGHVPLYASGLDPNAKQFSSLHATQQHMIDTQQCKMVYDGAEEEYEDFYDYSKALTSGASEEGQDIVMAGAGEPPAAMMNGYELVIPDQDGKTAKVLGTREFARFYKQKHRPSDHRKSVQVSGLQQRYRNLGVALIESPGAVQAKRAERQAQKQQRKGDRLRLNTNLQDNVNRNLPRNVTY